MGERAVPRIVRGRAYCGMEWGFSLDIVVSGGKVEGASVTEGLWAPVCIDVVW